METNPRYATPHQTNVVHQIQDVLVDVLVRVGRESAKDACRLGCSCKLLNKILKGPSVMREVNLSNFVEDTSLMYRYPTFFDLAIKSGNPKALYLCGLSIMLVAVDLENVVRYFNMASKAGIDHATYMFAILVIAYGQYPRALQLLDRVVGWRSRMNYTIQMGEEVMDTITNMRCDSPLNLPNVLDEFPKCGLKHTMLCCEECYLYTQYQLLRD